ncbi:Vacuolar protein [Rhizoctonia solani]|uniref:Vacuolar protein 8 n=1 Tax=Rhizoctonia solani TaxID=456999 RepID=A0A8H7M8W5_9AGAM|nr:Vacuolar protein [Rhizoctonia solani]
MKLASSEPKLVQSLVALMDSPSLKVQCQAALALRNLASDGELAASKRYAIKDSLLVEKYQLEIVKADGLQPLLRLLHSTFLPLILSSAACVRNVSIHPLNEAPIIEAGYLGPLVDLLSFEENEEVQCHAISTLRNLAASSEKNKGQIVAAAVLALSDELKPQLLEMGICEVLIPLTNSPSVEVQGNSAAALGNLSSKEERSSLDDYSAFNEVWDKPEGGLHTYLFRFLSSTDATFQHIAVWTIVQLLNHGCSTHTQHSLLAFAYSSHPTPFGLGRKLSFELTRGEIAALARRILEFTDGDGPEEEGASVSAGDDERDDHELRKSVRGT